MKSGMIVSAAVATFCVLLLPERTTQAVHTEQSTGPCRGRDRAMLCLALGAEHSNSSSNSSQDLGIMNQHLAVINFVTLGVVLGADELELPLLQSRSSLAAFATWTARDPAGLWNTTLLRSYRRPPGSGHWSALCCRTACDASVALSQVLLDQTASLVEPRNLYEALKL